MQVRHEIDDDGYRPAQLKSLDELRPGDIMLFVLNNGQASFTNKCVKYSQLLFDKRGGHYDTTHAAICLGFKKDAKGNKQLQYAHCTAAGREIIAMTNDFKFNRTLLVFRPKFSSDDQYADLMIDQERANSRLAMNAAQVAGKKRRKQIVWSRLTSLTCLFSTKQSHSIGDPFYSPIVEEIREQERAKHANDPKEKAKISAWTICSKFIIEIYQKAFQKTYGLKKEDPYFGELHPNSPVKVLEGHLYNKSDHFDYFVVPCENKLFEKIQVKIQEEISRLKNTTGWKKDASIHKANAIEVKLNETLLDLKDSNKNDYDKTKILLSALRPALMINTGFNLVQTTSYSHLLAYARSQGIYERDLLRTSVDDVSKSQKKRESISLRK